MPYQWGVWTSAWGRFRLSEGVDKAEVQEGIANGVLSCEDYFALVPGKTAV